jgi:hypothetical protein
MRKRIAALVLVHAFLAGVLSGQERYLKPVDEAGLDKSFLAFRTKVIAAAERRDAKYIVSILDRSITTDFGGSSGIARFKNAWKLGSKSTKFWEEFLFVIRNGGTFDPESGRRTERFVAPYSFSAFPPDLDAFEHAVIMGNGVSLRQEPRSNSKVIGILSYNLVKTSGSKGNETDWRMVETLGGKKGWVKAEYVRSPIDYRAVFEKKRGVWKMTVFVAGD